MPTVHQEHLRRPRLVGLAAKLLVALGFGVALLLLGGQAAHAADGPLGAVTHRGSPHQVSPHRGADRPVRATVTARVREATGDVIVVSAPDDAERTVRVLPHGDTEVATVGLRPRHVEVATPVLPAPVTPIDIEVPGLLPSLPSIDLPAVTAPAAHHASTEAAPVARHASPAGTTRSVVTTDVTPTAAVHRVARGTAPASPRHPTRPPMDRPSGDVPAGAAAATGLSLAVLGTLGRKAPSLGVQPVHTVDHRVPIAPTFEPSFTPD